MMPTSKTQHFCKDCGQSHPLHYVLYSRGIRHLAYRCDRSRKQHFVKWIGGLKIPTEETKPFQQEQSDRAQPTLF